MSSRDHTRPELTQSQRYMKPSILETIPEVDSFVDQDILYPNIYNPEFRGSISQLLCNLSKEQEEIIAEIGFSSFIALPSILFFDSLFDRWLLQHIDYSSSTLQFGGNSTLKIEDRNMEDIFGIPSYGEVIDVSRVHTSHGIQLYVSRCLRINDSTGNIISCCERILTTKQSDSMTENQKDAFALAFVAYIMYTFLVPCDARLGVAAPCFSALICRESIRNYNWSAYVRHCILNSAHNMQEVTYGHTANNHYDDLFPFLQVFYCEHAEFYNQPSVYNVNPRLVGYASSRIPMLLQSDYVLNYAGNVYSFIMRKLKSKRKYEEDTSNTKMHDIKIEVAQQKNEKENIGKHISNRRKMSNGTTSSNELISDIMVRFKKERASMIKTLTYVRKSMESKLDVLYQDTITYIQQ
ncbi:hypothetical protein ACP70R_044362 [Stipagrostis hirtigluma subsp. patula]